MPMLKEDETVVSRGFAATCKTKCVDLEGDELYKYCLSHCKRRPGWIEKKPFDPKEWERKTLEDVEKNVAIVEFTHSTKPETIEKVISVNTSGEDCQIKYFEGTTKCTKTYKNKAVRDVTFKEGK